mmetsp:Transcript_20829/g.67511  ORF Transcript_20829/g.67511 Transcript_20829/m.67511 type:complete len:345 (-) Transcript_20829:1190-2224(-)
MAKLLVQQPRAKRRDDERPLPTRRIASASLLDEHVHRPLPAPRIPEPPELAPVAVALAQEGDWVVEEPFAVECRPAAAHVEPLLPQVVVQLLERRVGHVNQLAALLDHQLVRVKVERLQQRLLERNRRAQVAVVLVHVAVAHHVDGAPPLHRVRRDCAELDQHGADAGAQRDLERVSDCAALHHGVHKWLRRRAGSHRVEERHAAVGLIQLGLDGPPPAEQAPLQRRRLGRQRKYARHLFGRHGAVKDAHLADIAVEVVLHAGTAVFGPDEDRRHLIGELRPGRRLGHQPSVHKEPHRHAVVGGHHLVPHANADGDRGDHVPRLHLAVEKRAQLRVQAQLVLAP